MAESTPTRRTLFTADSRFSTTPATDSSPAVITGYALVWNVLSSDRGGYFVRLLPNSATITPDVQAIWSHEFRDQLGDLPSGSLKYKIDDIGVKVEIDLPDTTAGRDVYELVRTKRLRGMSFGMTDFPEGFETTENGQTILNATAYTVDEFSVTNIPAFTQTSIQVKTDPSAAFAARRQQSLQLQRLKFQMCRLSGH